jgi:hypothetical protein
MATGADLAPPARIARAARRAAVGLGGLEAVDAEAAANVHERSVTPTSQNIGQIREDDLRPRSTAVTPTARSSKTITTPDLAQELGLLVARAPA